ncbi:polyphosphate kinase 2 family protein [Streptomyces sp. H10-C2]|uniref:PPK2 family polyphosphate kinase n=1 Tax=unclassified Streptomyces TaxID=2593676 RepID=UPI0024BAC720|nr:MULTISPECIES: PPK2 family polyphosphate kinase [unclassified Streptomyces]MDJ0340688.1 polyphosphate kinase 2 family protein [Streptomyces sp. PH10-H1]MDJ0372040.1 polyphosphate kinase 2 family protein [Streptomyces sp. H10-C2]
MAKDDKSGKNDQSDTSGKKQGGGKSGEDESAADVRTLLRVPPGGGPVKLKTYDTSGTPGGPQDKKRALAETAAMGLRLAELQEKLFAQSSAGDPRAMLFVLQGMDTSGKGGTVKHVVGQFNPAGLRMRAFKAPTDEEKQNPFLWRIRKALPEPGEIGIFDRSHYEDVLIVRVRNLVPRATWSKRYSVINRFEQSLADDGVSIVKVFLHVGYDEQRDRLLARLDNPDKHWKFNAGDIAERALWPAYQEAYEAALERCSTDAAPWYLVPADRKWYRNWAISKLLLEHLELMDPAYPKGDFDVEESRAQLLKT